MVPLAHAQTSVLRVNRSQCSLLTLLPTLTTNAGALLPILHQLFFVHETSNWGRSSTGFKPNPSALRCDVQVPKEELQEQVRACVDACNVCVFVEVRVCMCNCHQGSCVQCVDV